MRTAGVRVMLRVYVQIGGADESRPTAKEVEMEKAKEITPAEEIMVTTEEIVAEAKEEAKEAPSRLRQKLHELQATWERASIQFFQAPKL
jgi:hypothetical protein